MLAGGCYYNGVRSNPTPGSPLSSYSADHDLDNHLLQQHAHDYAPSLQTEVSLGFTLQQHHISRFHYQEEVHDLQLHPTGHPDELVSPSFITELPLHGNGHIISHSNHGVCSSPSDHKVDLQLEHSWISTNLQDGDPAGHDDENAKEIKQVQHMADSRRINASPQEYAFFRSWQQQQQQQQLLLQQMIANEETVCWPDQIDIMSSGCVIPSSSCYRYDTMNQVAEDVWDVAALACTSSSSLAGSYHADRPMRGSCSPNSSSLVLTTSTAARHDSPVSTYSAGSHVQMPACLPLTPPRLGVGAVKDEQDSLVTGKGSTGSYMGEQQDDKIIDAMFPAAAAGSALSDSTEALLCREREELSMEVKGKAEEQEEEEEEEEDREGEEGGVELIDLMVGCAEAIAGHQLTLATESLARLGRLASPLGSSSVHRLAACFAEALAWRAARLWPSIYHVGAPLGGGCHRPDDVDDAAYDAWQVVDRATPLLKFCHFTANAAILRAFEGEARVHVVDLDIKQGLQWPGLLQSLAAREGGAPAHVRMTGVGPCKEEVEEAGDRLADLAEELGLSFEFHAVAADRLEDVRLWMLHVKGPDEAVAINCALRLHVAGAASGGVERTLGLVASARPKVVVLAEQEVGGQGDGDHFEGRFAGALPYFAALFDALEAAGLPACGRAPAEALFAAHIRNVLACDGAHRLERYQPLATWHRLMGSAGFRVAPLPATALPQAQILLRMFSSSSYRLLSPLDPPALTLAWLHQPLFTVSAWSPLS